MMSMRERRWLVAVSASLCCGILAATPVAAQTEPPRGGPGLAAAASSAPWKARLERPRPIADSARAMAVSRAGELTVAPPNRSSGRCAAALALGGAAGAGIGVLGGYALLVEAGGSDSGADILRGFAILGAVLGAFGGLIVCTA